MSTGKKYPVPFFISFDCLLACHQIIAHDATQQHPRHVVWNLAKEMRRDGNCTLKRRPGDSYKIGHDN